MKIAVILPCNMYAAPFYRRFENILNNSNFEFDLIYWNRSNIDENTSGNKVSFNLKDQVMSGKKSKILKYILFAKFVKKNLKLTRYDRIFFLGSYGGIMAVLSLFLRRNYKSKYWLDIRDYSFEEYKPYFEAMKIAIKNSYATSISSPGFKYFLPNDINYIQTHNIDRNNISKIFSGDFHKQSSDVIRISYIGLVGFYEENKKLLLALKNDVRFRLQYYGANSEPLKKFCEIEEIKNVEFHGRFLPEETMRFYEKTDIVNNVYGNNNINLRTALSNKLYFATALRMPILVSPNTFMSEITTKYGYGYNFNLNDEKFGDKLFEWYMEFLNGNTQNHFNQFWEKAHSEDLIFENRVKEFLSI